jgi:hypothetical protein
MFASLEEKGKIFTHTIKKLPVKVIIQTPGQTIHGNVHIRPEQRLKDEVNAGESFLAVTDAQVLSLDGKVIQKAEFLLINRDQITWIIPVDEPKPNGG